MAIPSREIGWSGKANLLWQISKQLQYMTYVAGNIQINPLTGGWSKVTGGEAGDGTVAQYSSTGFNITGPDDNQGNGWVYIKKYFATETSLSVDYQWASADDTSIYDWPVYCIDATEPTGIPSDLTVQVVNTPESDTWNITIPAGNWFSVGIYSDDSCCGKGFLSVDVLENVVTPWVFTAGTVSVFPVDTTDYTLYTDGFTNNDDGNANTNVPFAGTFYANNIAETEYNLSTNGYIIASISEFQLSGNNQDLFLTPGDLLSDGDTQNFWYNNYVGTGRWRTKILVYCGHCCDAAAQETPYSYVLNIYRDNEYQYVEACCKVNNDVVGDAGPESNLESAVAETQVWRTDLGGTTWTYLGFGSIS